MSPQCEQAVAEMGNGVGASLRGVDCLASDMTQAAFGRLFGAGGALAPALTILLTLFVAFFAFSLITGRSRIGIRSLTPRMMTLGLVLTFATSWIAYQSVVWNLAIGAPDQIASILTGVEGSATHVFADKIDVVFSAIQQATNPGAVPGAPAREGAEQAGAISTFSPEGILWMGATLLLLGTVGVLVTARIALAVLVAVGPVFVVMALFPATRGLFAGWLRGLVMLAVTPLFAVLGGTLMLEVAVPVINSLSIEPGKIDPRAAMAFLMIGAVHVALMVLVVKTASSMVGSWTVFGLAGQDASSGDAARSSAHSGPAAGAAPARPPAQSQPAPRRSIAVSGVSTGMAANDASGTAQAASRTVNVTHTHSGGGQASSAHSSVSRARGIGSRFRAAPGSAKIARSSETMK